MEHQAQPYVLGDSSSELDRLARQAAFVDPVTERILTAAGIAPGMRVLDVGTGAGHVAFVTADLVGADGEVVGIDRSEAALAAAAEEAARRGLRNVSFQVGDPTTATFDQPFDAVVGRYVLQFLADPATALRRLATSVRAGGVLAFHELDWGGVWSFPPAPTYDACCRWCVEALASSGAQTGMGLRLHSTFVAAGLPDTTLLLEAALGAASPTSVPVRQLVHLVRTLAPVIEQLGLATADQLEPSALEERIITEARSRDSVLLSRLQVGCWATV